MEYQVISAFQDKRTGDYVEAGQPVPEGLDDETIARLVEAKCLKPISRSDLFAGDGDGEADDSDEGDAADGQSPAARKPKAKK
jgi:hypothetical protein